MGDIHKKLDDMLLHYGAKGMKWGYNDGVPNGKRSAGEDGITTGAGGGSTEEDPLEKLERVRKSLEGIRADLERTKSETDKIANSDSLAMLKKILSGAKATKNTVSKVTVALGNTLKSVGVKQKESGKKILKSIFGR